MPASSSHSNSAGHEHARTTRGCGIGRSTFSGMPSWDRPHSPAQPVHAGYLRSGQHLTACSTALALSTSASNAPGLANLQGLLRIYKQSLDDVRRPGDTLRPRHVSHDDEDVGDDVGWAAAAVRTQLNEAPITNVRELDLSQLAMAISAYVAANDRPPQLVLEQVAQRLEAVVVEEFDPDEVTTTLKSLSFFGFEPSETLIEAIRAALTSSYFTNCTSGQLVHLLHAIAEVGHRNTKLLDAAAQEVMDNLVHYNPEQLSELLWSFAILGHLHPHLVDTVTQTVLFKLRDMPVATICQLVCSFAVLKHKDAVTDVLLDAVSDEAIKRIKTFEASDMANMLWAYASLGHWSRIDSDLMEAVVLRMLRLYRELNADGLVNVVWAIAKTDHVSRLTKRLLEGIARAALDQLSSFRPEHLSRLLWAYSQLRHYSPELYSAVAYEALEKLDLFEPQHAADLMFAYASMVHHPGDLFQRLTAHIFPRLDVMDAGALCNVIWAQGVLRMLTTEFFIRVCNRLETMTLSGFEPQCFERAFQAELLLEAELEAAGELRIPRLPGWVRSYAFRAWQDRVYFDRNISRVQQEVCRSLMELGVNFELEKHLEDGCHTVDIVLRVPQRPKLAVMLDPPQRFSANKPYRPLAEAVCQRRLLEAQDWHLIIIAQHDWRRYVTQDERARFLQGLLDEHLLPPGGETWTDEAEAVAAYKAAAAAVKHAAAMSDSESRSLLRLPPGSATLPPPQTPDGST